MTGARFLYRLSGRGQISESFPFAACLALSGGFQDAYTYIVRGRVFANAQTGNVVLMSTCLIGRQWMDALGYLFPVLAFVSGVLAADYIRHHRKGSIRWQQKVLLAEILILLVVGFLPQSLNMVASALVSFSCAMQIQAFQTLDGNAYASTMCIGNLRSGTASLSKYFRSKDKSDLKRTAEYYGVIVVFAIGAGIGGNLSELFGERMIWVSCIILFADFCLMESTGKHHL